MNKKYIFILILLSICFNLNKYDSELYIYKSTLQSDLVIHKQITNQLKIYNPNISNNTVSTIIKVIKFFDISKYNDYLVAQLCYESNGKQYDGDLIMSSSNAIGIAQIKPETAFHYIRNLSTVNEIKSLCVSGCDDFSFVFKKNGDTRYILTSSNRQNMIKWLSVKKNNLILWGFIMKHNIKKYGNIQQALLVYNTGNNKLFGDVSNHTYVKRITQIKKQIK